MVIIALLLTALLCLLFDNTRGFGLMVLIVLCLLFPVLLVVFMAIALGLYLYNRSHSKTTLTFLPKE